MAQTIGEYLYRIAWSLDRSGAANLRKEGDAAQKSVDGLGKSLDKTETEAQDLTRAADKTAPAVRNIGTAATGAGGDLQNFDELANKAAEGLKRLIKQYVAFASVRRTFTAILNTATQLDALANSAAAVGASAAGMARLAYATDLAGVNAGEMETTLKAVRQSAAQAAAGIGAGVKAWKMIGISTRDENGNLKDTTRLIDELGAKFSQMDEGRAQALGKLLKMSPMVVTAMRSGMMEYAREFDQALGKMTPSFDEAVKAAQRLHSAQSRLTRIMGLLWQGIASRFFEPFAKAFDTIRQAVINNQAALVRFGSAVLQPLAYALSMLAGSISVVSNALSALTMIFDSLGPVAQTAIEVLLWGGAAYLLALKKITAAQLAAMATNPFLWIAAGITAVMLLLDDYIVAMRGGKSYFSWDWVKDLSKWGDEIVEWFKSLPDKAIQAAKDIGKAFTDMWDNVMQWFAEKWDAFVKMVTGWMPDALKKQLGLEVEGETDAKQFTPEPASPVVGQLLDTSPERQELIRQAGGQVPAAEGQQPLMPTHSRVAEAVRQAEERSRAEDPRRAEKPAPSPTPQRFVTALVGGSRPAAAPALSGGVQPAPAPVIGGATTNIANTFTTMAAARRTLTETQPLGSTTITNNNDNSRKYDIPVTVNNSTNISITTTDAEPAAIGSQVSDAVDASNAKLVRDMQSPLAAVADTDTGNSMTTE